MQMTMLLVGGVLLIMMGIITVYMYREYRDGLRLTMQQVVEPLDAFAQPMEQVGRPDQQPERPHASDDSMRADPEAQPQLSQDAASKEDPGGHDESSHDEGGQQGIMTVFYIADSGETAILSQESLYDEDTLTQILTAVSEQGAGYGTLGDLHVIYYCTGNGNPYKIALTSTSYMTMRMLRLVLVLTAIWGMAMSCLLIVSIQMSRIAVRPMEEAMKRERQFVADASHDLKTPLSVILANNSILRENPADTVADLMRWIDSTQTAAENMQRMISDMLTLADVERKDIALVMEDVDAAEILMRAVLQLESVAYEKAVELSSDLPDTLSLRSNEDYLLRIATSLIENAIKYEPAGGRVVVRLLRRAQQAELTVTNQHATIDPTDLPHIFERFYRADKSRGSGAGGHGLGLAITRQMVERVGGQITASSNAERGTCFTVYLPM